MKQVFRRLAAATLAGAMLAMPCAGAVSVASTVQDLTEKADASGKFTIDSATSGVTLKSGNEYVLLVAKGTYDTTNNTANVTIDASTLTYIDQKTASGSSISFDFIPSSKPNSVILLGGEFEGGVTSPVVIGYITSTGETITISGKITVVGSSGQNLTDITFSFTADKSDGVNVDSSGSVEIPADATTIYISRPGYLTMTIKNYDPSKQAALEEGLAKFQNGAGDISGDDRITAADVTLVITKLKNTQDCVEDINRDGRVTPSDVTVTISAIGKTAVKDMVIDLD